MALTLRGLVASADLALRVLVEGPNLDRPLTWVHVSELVDPTPFLSGGELLLTTGIGFPPGRLPSTSGAPADPSEYVRRLSDAGVVGLGFGTGLSHQEVPQVLVAAALEHGLPILEVPRDTPFIAISRAVSKAVAADEYAAVTATFTAQQALTKAALSPAGPGRLVRLLAQQLHGWVALLDASGAPIATHPEPAQSAAVRSSLSSLEGEVAALAAHPGTVSSGFTLGGDTVSLQSVGASRRGRAFLAVGRAGQLSASERHLVNAAVMLLTIRLEQSPTTDQGLIRIRGALLQLVLAGQAQLARPIVEQLSGSLPAEPLAVLVAIGDVQAAIARLDESRMVRGVLSGELHDEMVILAGESDADSVAGLFTDVAGVAVGISQNASYATITAAHREAAQAAGFGQRSGRAVTHFTEVAMPGITGILDHDQVVAFAYSLLAPLIEHDQAGRGDLVESLRAWLAHHGQWDPSAAQLGVHRHTLRHRIRTVEELLGRGLDSPGTRAELWLALSVLPGAGAQ